MWRKEETNSQPSSPETSTQTGVTNANKTGSSSPASSIQGGSKTACVSQGIKIKGEVVGTEDLFIDGVIEGKITLANSGVTVGPNGKVKADISAREIVLRGLVEGKFTADERIQIWHTARVQGELKSQRISIEDGAELRGKVEAGKAIATAMTADAAGRGKKPEQSKTTDTPAKEAGTTTGAATAGAD